MRQILRRTQAALESMEHIFDGEVTYDAARIAAIMERFEHASPGPYIAVSGDKALANWPVLFSGGVDSQGVSWAVTTHNIHASELVSGGAKEDCKFAAHAWEDLRYLVRLVQQQQAKLWDCKCLPRGQDIGT